MKYVVAPDSFKGSISSIKACQIICDAIKTIDCDAEVIEFPISDGGEGFIDVLQYHEPNLKKIEVVVLNSDGRPIIASYLLNTATKEAFIESAQAIGLHEIAIEKTNIYSRTSYGLGELMIDALERGSQEITISLGGSATNDAGIGLLHALGAIFIDDDNKIVEPSLLTIESVKTVLLDRVESLFGDTRINVLTDVTNPLLGENGATFVYGPQKGATQKDCESLELKIEKWHQTIMSVVETDFANKPGSGAAGGLGYILTSVLDGEITSGIDYVMKKYNFEKTCEGANLVITGEGKFDKQSYYGKVVGGIAKVGKKNNASVICVAGIVDDYDIRSAMKIGLSGAFSVLNGPISLNESMAKTEKLLFNKIQNITLLFKSIKINVQ